MNRSAHDLATLVDERMDVVFGLLDAWRGTVEEALGAAPRPAAIDELVAGLVLPRLAEPNALVSGAGFIADSDVVSARGVHFAWWLGPLDDNPVLGATTEPTRLDITTRGYAEYLRDFRSLEWFRAPATTFQAHVTGPYVDHLCTCDYILTFTSPVSSPTTNALAGVVGADVAVRRLEQDLLPAFLDADEPVALVNADGRVVLSTAPALQVGTIADAETRVACARTPFSVLVRPMARRA
ncbi:hypothetical protein [Microbacterium candidum]|uniref:Cache domain-containing protein n=1 Tax=Microbacterium candidum TaxID=3041922 RepID=A0ABT7N1C2_9MICO|nr:hypothetical protein [Microbacterium sp. ASV49]MDL9980497.1 hypothetical protein [Microbacterium sp. ASV49]